MEYNTSTNISAIQTESTYKNILKTPSDYATPEEIDSLFSETAHEKRIKEIEQEMRLNYTGTATSGDKTGNITIPPATLTQISSNAPHSPPSEARIYKEMLEKGNITPHSIKETHLSLSDVLKYIKDASGNTQGKAPEIYTDLMAAKIYKEGKYSKAEQDNITKALTTYLGFFEKTGLIEKETAEQHDSRKDRPNHYAINEKLLHQYTQAYKQAITYRADNMSTMEANELFVKYLGKEMNEKKHETWRAYS